jgi:wyosine [tRNA(Phe)-imidazoG37] synthetase (radical SAM superfamily)
MFVDGDIQNIGEQEIREWIEKVSEVKPMNTQIYSLHRPPAEPSLREVLGERLQEIARQTEEATGVPVEVIVAASPYRRSKRRHWK